MIGERMGKWVIYKELGRGGMGRVYLAQEELTGKHAALKVLAAELAQDVGFLQRFQREIDALSKLDHPGIVRFYESGCENGLYFYAMEYVEGESLDNVVAREGRLPWQEVLDIALQVCPALKHAHDHGIIHRDIKPANLLRTPEGRVKLTDFGIAKVFAGAHLTATGGVVGTAEYLSPEQATGKPVTKRSDIYSLGITFYVLLTGRPPFEGATIVDLLHKHRYGQFDKPGKVVPGLPYELDEIVCQMLEKEPGSRPADCLVLAKQLESLRLKVARKDRLTEVGERAEETVAENRLSGGGPGAATLMSRLVREELERENRGGPVAQFLNRPFVLVPLFLLVVGVIVWTFWPASAETLFARGSELMASDSPSDWEAAWRDYLGPLEERFPDHPYGEDVERYRHKLEAWKQGGGSPAVSEAERFYRQGERWKKEGNAAAARQVWGNVVAAFAAVPSEAEWVKKSRQAVAELDRARPAARDWAPVRAALKKAAALAAEGKRDEAKRIWAGVEALYHDDPDAVAIVEEVRAARGGK